MAVRPYPGKQMSADIEFAEFMSIEHRSTEYVMRKVELNRGMLSQHAMRLLLQLK